MLKSYCHILNESSHITNPVSYYPNQLAAIYNFPTNFNGTGQTIGFIELGGGFKQVDLDKYFKSLNLHSPTVRFVSVDGGRNNPTNSNSADAEVMLDLCVAIGAANNIQPVVYMAPNTFQGFIDAVSKAINDRVNIISISWGAPENEWSAPAMQQMNNLFQSASLLGITVCVASGDSGSSDGEGGQHVDFPGSSPYVLCCGGTTCTASNNTIISETVWNDLYGATGGGFSSTYTSPSYQAHANTGNTKRGVPDVAANADPNTGIKVIVDGKNLIMGGTSAAAPFWASLIAVLNQALNKHVGFINPILYSINSNSFHDITSGNNGAFTSRTGWDACTGLGSPNGQRLLAAWPR